MAHYLTRKLGWPSGEEKAREVIKDGVVPYMEWPLAHGESDRWMKAEFQKLLINANERNIVAFAALKEKVILGRSAGTIEAKARQGLRDVMVQRCLYIFSTTISDPASQSQQFKSLYKDLQKNALLQYWFEGVIKAQKLIVEETAIHEPWFEDGDVSVYDGSGHHYDTAETSGQRTRSRAAGSAGSTMSAEEVRALGEASDGSADGNSFGGRSRTLASWM